MKITASTPFSRFIIKTLLSIILLAGFISQTQAQRRFVLEVYQVSTNIGDCDGFLSGDSDPAWWWTGADINDECYEVTCNGCTQAPIRTLYDQTFTCAGDVPASIQATFHGCENDGAGCLLGAFPGICDGNQGNTTSTFTFPASTGTFNQTQICVNATGCSGQFCYRARWVVTGNFAGTQANDNICSATLINTSGTVVTGNNTCATTQSGEVSAGGNVSPSRTVWYYFTAPASAQVEISTDWGGTTFDTEIALWQQTSGTACTFNTLQLVDSDDDIFVGINNNSEFVVNCLTPGTRYYIQVDGDDASDFGQFQISVSATGPAASNDDCANAINIGTLPFNGAIGNPNASTYNNFCADAVGDPQPGWLGGNEQGVWFTFNTGPNPGVITELEAYNDPSSAGDQIDLQIALYSGPCNALNYIDRDYTPPLYGEEMQVTCLQPNTTYRVLVDGFDNLIGGHEGYFGMQIRDNGIAQVGDIACNATPLGTVPNNGTIGTTNIIYSNICATATGDPDPNAWNPDSPVWFTFVSPPSGSVQIDGYSDLPFPLGDDAIDIQLAVYDFSGTPPTCTGTPTEFISDYDPILSDEEMDVRCLVPGRQYWVLLDGGGGIGGTEGNFGITITDLQQFPATNDVICDAIPIGAPLPGSPVGLNNQNNYCADNVFEPVPSTWGNEHGVWFTFVAPPSGEVNIYTTNTGDDNLDLQVAVFDVPTLPNCPPSSFYPHTERGSDWDGFGIGFFDEDLNVRCLVPGRTYYVLVDGNASILNPENDFGEFNISIEAASADPPAANDLICNAIYIGNPDTGPVTTDNQSGNTHPTQNNFCATDAGDPDPGFTTDQTVWFTFAAPSTGSIEIQAVSDALLGDNPIDLQIAVFESSNNTCNGSLIQVGGDYDAGFFDEDVTVHCLQSGQIYYIMVDGSSINVEGYFDLTLTEIPPLPVPANDDICQATALGNPFAAPVGATNQFNLCATDFGDPDPDNFDTDQTVWYTFTTPPTGGPYAANVALTSDWPWPLGVDAVDLQVAVFESSNNGCNGVLNEMTSADGILFDVDANIQCLEAGHTYYVMVDGSFINVQGYFDIDITSITPLPIPTNDLICSSINLGTVPAGGSINTNTNYYNFCADVEPGEPNNAFGIDQTVWFTFTAPLNANPLATSNLTININNDPNSVGDQIDVQAAVYESSNNGCTGTLSELGSDDDLFSFDGQIELHCLTPGQTYFLQVDGSGLNTEGYFTIDIQDDGFGTLPANDDICGAVNLGAIPNGGQINNGVVYNNFCATTQAGEPDPSTHAIEQTVWFSFIAPASGNATIVAQSDPTNLGDEIDLQVAVWDSPGGTCAGPFLEHESDYDPLNYDEDVTLSCLEPGVRYWIQVDGADNGIFGGIEGYFTIRIEDDGGTTNFPYNNDICNAHNFGTPTGTTQTLNNENNNCANLELGEPGLGGYAEHTVWYSFTAPPSGRIDIDVDGNQFIGGIDPEVHLFSSSNNGCTGSLTQIDQSYIPGNTSILAENIYNTCLVPGNTYFIQIDGTTIGQMGDFTISITDPEPLYGTGVAGDPSPVNNECATASPVTVQDESCFVGAGTFELENYGQPSISPNIPQQNCGTNCGDTWFTFTMPATGIALIEGNDDDINGGFPGLGDYSNLVISTYTGTCNSLVPVECGAGGLGTDISYQIVGTPGSTIYLQVMDDGNANEEEFYELCVSEACGADDCLDALAVPILPNIPYCFDLESASGEDVNNGEPGYSECTQGQSNDNPENSVYYSFTTDCNGTGLTLSIINASIGGNCVFSVPTDGFSISLFQDNTPCDNNPQAQVDCQSFDNCDGNTINWSQTYTNLSPNTTYVIQLEGGIGTFGSDVNGEIMIATTVNPVATTTVIQNVSCAGGSDGSAIVTPQPSTGQPPFTYLWNNGETSQTAVGLNAGVHQVTVTDQNGCTTTSSVTITEPAPIVPVGTSTNITTTGGTNGTAGVSVSSGGTPPYTYLWSNGQSGANISGLAAGVYTVTVTDDNGCATTTSVTVTEPCTLTATITGATTNCTGNTTTLNAVATGIGGNPTLTYHWSNNASTPSINITGAGTFSVTITYSATCSATATQIVTLGACAEDCDNGTDDDGDGAIDCADSDCTVSVLASANSPCSGQSVQLTATAVGGGGNGNFSYAWTGVAGYIRTGRYPDIDNATSANNGTYTVTATASTGCSANTSVTVTVNNCPEICANGIDDDHDGQIDNADSDCPCGQ